jgi:uncharacterized DUF497 family protein
VPCITICVYKLRYEWDEAKNRWNQRKHGGITFEAATLVFEDERCLVGPDRIDETGEQRLQISSTVRCKPFALRFIELDLPVLMLI